MMAEFIMDEMRVEMEVANNAPRRRQQNARERRTSRGRRRAPTPANRRIRNPQAPVLQQRRNRRVQQAPRPERADLMRMANNARPAVFQRVEDGELIPEVERVWVQPEPDHPRPYVYLDPDAADPYDPEDEYETQVKESWDKAPVPLNTVIKREIARIIEQKRLEDAN